MKIHTRKFGELEIDEKMILDMPDGLPGFDGYKRFVLLEDAGSKPFCWFQSVEASDLALVVMNPYLFKPDYQVDLKGVMALKGWKNVTEKDLGVFVVLNIFETRNGKKITANLIGPLVINMKKNEVVQVVFEDAHYSHQYLILDPSV
ncbi:MAG: flagellar assembly protein FliW [Desulfobacteraceae bacterium]|nr:flagellar assembly protein FliW [Desulfobacteraceae bacterium]